MNTLFCRHNRFTADCPICSKGTVLDPGERSGARSSAPAKPKASGARGAARTTGPAGAYRGPYAAAGPYERDGAPYEVRLERVPGGVRIAEWASGVISRSAPVLPAEDLVRLVEDAGARDVLRPRDHDALSAALAEPPAEGDPRAPGPAHGASRARSGDMQEELRLERLEDGRVRTARWMLRPGEGWILAEAPTMFPAARYAEAFRDAARRGLLGGSV